MKKSINSIFGQTVIMFGFKGLSAIIVFLLLFATKPAYADCGRATCSYIGDPAFATTSWQTVSGSVVNGTTYNRYDFYLYAGNTYEFSLCSTDGGAADYDSYLCLYGYGYGCGYTTFLTYNDDACGLQSKITYLATSTGWTSLYISGYGSAFGTYTLAYRYTSPCTTPTAVTVFGGGNFCSSITLTATGGTGGTIYWQGTTSNGTSTDLPRHNLFLPVAHIISGPAMHVENGDPRALLQCHKILQPRCM